MVVILLANALFSALVTKFSRRRFIPIIQHFFIANLILFYLLMKMAPTTQQIWVGRSFFVWVSVFNLFVVTVFWASWQTFSMQTIVTAPHRSLRFGV